MKQREIKFRAWDGEKMLGQDWVGVANGRALVLDTGKSKDWPLMQYTGLKDKNRRKIYEGDVVRYNWRYTDGSRIGEVLFDNGCWAIDDHDRTLNACLMNTNISNPEVIGNIYENPELLKP